MSRPYERKASLQWTRITGRRDCFHPRGASDPATPFGDISRPRHGWVGIVAGRGEQLRGRRAVARLRLSGFSSAMVTVPASTSSLLWSTSDGPSGEGSRLAVGRLQPPVRRPGDTAVPMQTRPCTPLLAVACSPEAAVGDRSTVHRAQRNEAHRRRPTFEDRRGSRPTRPRADTPVVVDRHEQSEPITLGLPPPVSARLPCCGAAAEHLLGDRHGSSVEPTMVRIVVWRRAAEGQAPRRQREPLAPGASAASVSSWLSPT